MSRGSKAIPTEGTEVCQWHYRGPGDDDCEWCYRNSNAPKCPTIVCLCGSTKFGDAFRDAMLRETLEGKIVLTVGCVTQSDAALMASGVITDEVKTRLDELHKRKIDLADEILVLNVGGYIGDSTRSEIAYARKVGKRVRWLEFPDI